MIGMGSSINPLRGQRDRVQYSRGRVLGGQRHPGHGAAGEFGDPSLCVSGDGQPGAIHGKDREHLRTGLRAAQGEQPHGLAGEQRREHEPLRHPGQAEKQLELHHPERRQHLHGQGVHQARGGQRNGPERGHGQRFHLLGGHLRGQHDPARDHQLCIAPGADGQVRRGIRDGFPAFGGLCHASERGGEQHCLRESLRKEQRGGDRGEPDAAVQGHHL